MATFVLFALLTGIAYGQTFDFLENPFSGINGRDEVESRIVELVNIERSKAGLAPVTSDARLRSAARQHSLEMLEQRYFSHYSPQPSLRNPEDRAYRAGLSDAVIGENIAVHSVDGGAEETALQLMHQWMNSEPHKANILKPEFTHLGVGVASFKDSTRRDTVVGGAKGHLITYTIRHYGTQLFSQRRIDFEELKLVQQTREFFVIELAFQFDRDMLATIGSVNRFFRPADKRVTMTLDFPVDSVSVLSIAAVQNEQALEYGVFFEDRIDRTNFLKTLDRLSVSPITVLGKSIRIETKSRYFLRARGRIVNPQRQSLTIHMGTDRFVDIGEISNAIAVEIPLDPETRRVSFAMGTGALKDAGQQVRINLKDANNDGFDKRH